jgi:hypothetical protein
MQAKPSVWVAWRWRRGVEHHAVTMAEVMPISLPATA